ncbi:MAG: site-specific integrase, partial [Methanobacteriaceae archaeon]|nr:site-specific integrase [Methanobacteriaceae archaeon]
ELINEAKNEEKPYIENNQAVFLDIDDRKVKKYLYQYYAHLKNQDICDATIDSYLKTLRSFYNEYEIQLPKNIQIETITELIQEDEIITKEKIRLALETTNNFRNKAIILLMTSSGIRSGDIRNFTVSDFLNATKDYHEGSIETLFESKEDIIPTWYFVPEKTKKKGNICVTFNTPEASKYIIQYLKKRNNLTQDDYLFEAKGKQLGKWGLIEIFRKINEKNFGRTKKGKRYFKAHSLRKFFITKCSHNSGDLRKIALLSGHAPPIKTDQNYISINFKVMKQFYISLIPALSIRDTKVHDFKSKEYLELEKRLGNKDKENQEIRAKQEEISKEFKKILEYATNDPDGFADFLKNMNKQ